MSDRVVVALRVVDAILEGEPVDWAAAQSRADGAGRQLLTNLHVLDRIAAAAGRAGAGTSKPVQHGPGASPAWTVPFITARAIVVEQVLEIRLQRALARATLVVVTVLPFVLVLAYGYAHRHLTLSELLSGSRVAVLLPLTGVGLVVSGTRHRAIALINRRFFRSPTDLGHELAALSAGLRSARSVPEIVERLDSELQRILQLTFARTFFHTGALEGFTPVQGQSPLLPRTTAIAELLTTDHAPLRVGPREARTLFGLLPAEERAWVEQMSIASIVPVIGSRDTQMGFIALGAKVSGASLKGGELSILGAAASAAALAIEARRQAAPGTAVVEEDEPASECPGCGGIDRPEVERCDCGNVRRVASVPLVLAGKFRVERRLGAGGMGVVYAGRDVALGRAVALKTLSHLTATAAERLSQEARMMASVVHPNLVTIFGLERWRSTPILIVELLERGTLAARIATGPMPVDQVTRIGVLLAGALEQLHTARVLHRDVKPSNIAFSAGEAPKLLDFGLASFVSARLARHTAAAADEAASARTWTVQLAAGSVAGTPLYLPPEAIAGRAPEAAWDLWALSLVLYEAIAGRHPFTAPSIPEVLANIGRTRVPDVRRFRPDCPEATARTLASLLSADSKNRPPSARALQERLQDLPA